MSDLPFRSAHANRIAWRFARRTIARHRVRSILIAVMVAVPIIGLTGMITLYTSLIATQQETLTTQLGATQAVISVVTPPDPTLVQEPLIPSSYSMQVDENGNPTAHQDSSPLVAPSAYLPHGTRIIGIRTTNVVLKTSFGVGGFATVEGAAWDASLEGRYSLLDGRAPRTDSEILVTPAALTRLGVRVGDQVTMDSPKTGTLTVVGELRDRQQAASRSMIFARDGALDGTTADADPASSSYYLPDTRIDESALASLNHHGAIATSRYLFDNPPAGAERDQTVPLVGLLPLIGLVGAFVVFQVCLLAGAAFLVGTRADVRALATMASTGADRRVVFRSVSFGGLGLGLAGAVVGSVIGVVAAGIVYNALDDGTTSTYPGFHVWPVVILAVIALGVGCGWISSLIGARSAARVDIIRAMRGLAKPRRPSRRGTAVRVIVALVGLVTVFAGGYLGFLGAQEHAPEIERTTGVILLGLGAIVLQLGVILIVPLVLTGFARLFGGASTAARLAARDGARNAGRSIPVLAAVMSTVFLAAFVATFGSSLQAESIRYYSTPAGQGVAEVGFESYDAQGEPNERTAPADVVKVLAGVFPGSNAFPVTRAFDSTSAGVIGVQPDVDYSCSTGPDSSANCEATGLLSMHGYGHSPIMVGTADEFALVTGARLTTEDRTLLDHGGAVALYPALVKNGTVTLHAFKNPVNDPMQAPALVRTYTLKASLAPLDYAIQIGLLITPQTAHSLGIKTSTTEVALRLDRQPTDTEYDAVQAGLDSISHPRGTAYLQYSAPPSDFATTLAWILLAVAAVIMVASSAVGIGLARADARRDDEVLDAIGAPPALRRRIALWQGLVIAGIGAVLGTAIGVLPNLALAVQFAAGKNANPVLPIAPPWLQLALLAFGVPLVIAVMSWLTAGRQRVRVRRAA